MWFKNLCVFQLKEAFNLTPEELHEALAERTARHCSALETTSFGWAPPLGNEHTFLVHAAMGYNMLTAKQETKLLPATVVRQHVEEKIREIQRTEGRKVSSREKAKLREDTTFELLPRAFHKTQSLYAYIDTRHQLIIIDTANLKKADTFLELLRECLGSFNVGWPEVKTSPNHVMSQWLLNKEAPKGFTIEDMCELVNRKGDGSIIKCVKQDMTSDEIQEHINAGKQVTQLALTWEDRISFVLCDNLLIKRIKFLDLILSEAHDAQVETPEERFDADFAIMTSAISHLLPAVFTLFGGLENALPTLKTSKTEAAETLEVA